MVSKLNNYHFLYEANTSFTITEICHNVDRLIFIIMKRTDTKCEFINASVINTGKASSVKFLANEISIAVANELLGIDIVPKYRHLIGIYLLSRIQLLF